jgi:hypothetical protein
MTPTETREEPIPPPYAVPAAVLSYLVPGLGQIIQGRVGKGFLFMVCLLGLFLVGLMMGGGQNVYIPDPTRLPPVPVRFGPVSFELGGTAKALAHRLHYVGQFWIGIAAWPAIWQYNNMPVPSRETNPYWHDFQRGPRDLTDEDAVNAAITNSDKTPDLGWVYTVIAGVLNILVIYDALVGPAFGPAAAQAPSGESPKEEAAVA